MLVTDSDHSFRTSNAIDAQNRQYKRLIACSRATARKSGKNSRKRRLRASVNETSRHGKFQKCRDALSNVRNIQQQFQPLPPSSLGWRALSLVATFSPLPSTTNGGKCRHSRRRIPAECGRVIPAGTTEQFSYD